MGRDVRLKVKQCEICQALSMADSQVTRGGKGCMLVIHGK